MDCPKCGSQLQEFDYGFLKTCPTCEYKNDHWETKRERAEDPGQSAHIEDTDSKNIKKISTGFLVLRGTKTVSKLKTTPGNNLLFAD